MHDQIIFAVSVFMGFFAIMNPVANTSIFLSLTAKDDNKTIRTIARNSVVLAFFIVFTFIVGGNVIFNLFDFTLPAFRITGGLLVFLIGFQMLHGEQSSVHNPNEEDQAQSLEAELSVAVSPLAMPILAGPGAISTAMNFVADSNLDKIIITTGMFALMCLVTYFFFISGQKIIKYIGQNGIKVITRLMGLILAVIGTQMVITGIYGAIHLFK